MKKSVATSSQWIPTLVILLLFGCSLCPQLAQAGLYWEVDEYPGQQFPHDFALTWDGAFAALDFACTQNDGQPGGTYSGSITQDSANTFPARKGGWCLVNTFIGLIEGAYYTAQLYCNGVARELFDNSACPDVVTPTANPNLGNCNCDGTQACVGNPIHIGNGNKYQREAEYHGEGPFPLRFVRHYNSQDDTTANAAMGNNWRHTYERGIQLVSATEIIVQHPDGKRFSWTDPGTGFESVADRGSRLVATAGGWEYTRSDDIVEVYDSAGLLQSITNRSGLAHTLSYQGGLLQTVTGPTGTTLDFIYDANGRLEALTVPGNRDYHYGYDPANGNLTSVTYPAATTPAPVRTYHYADAGFPHYLTGITDERNILYATFEYDSLGRAMASYHGPQTSVPTDRVDGVTIDHEPAGLPAGSRELVNSRGFLSTYTTTSQNGVNLVLEVSGPGCSSCGTGNSSYVYDPNNNLLSKVDNGITTRYGNYDERGNYRCKVEGISAADTTPPDNATCQFDPVASLDARRLDYTYDPRFQRRIATITEPSVYSSGQKLTTYDYDDQGNRTLERIDGFRPDGVAVSRATAYAHGGDGSPECAGVPLHQLCLIDGPRTDVVDITRFRYYPDEAAQGDNRARLKEIEDANGVLIRSAIQYTASTKVTSEDRPNGLHLSYLYDPRDRLESLTESDGSTSRTTRWSYLANGEVKSITQGYGTPEAATLTFAYDDARRLTRITDGLGNYIEYVLDTEGNKRESNVHDNTSVLRKQLTQTFDLYNRLDVSAQMNESVDSDYAPDGTLDLLTDGKGSVSDYDYDALKRLTRVIQDQGGTDATTANATNGYGYDVQDRLVSVTDPINGNTSYTYDDLGNLLNQTSPDTGITSFQYDAAGNIVQKTDALGQVFIYSYDVLNRLTGIDGPGTSDDISYLYDNCTQGVGRLCTVIYGSGAFPAGNQIHYQYNGLGDPISQGSLVYGYDAQGRVTSINYPSGARLSYGYDAAGQLDLVNFTLDSSTQTLANAISYAPFGPLTALSYGNGLSLNQSFDNAYRVTGQTIAGVLERSYPQYDPNGNRLQQTDALASPSSFAYDPLNRLDTTNGPFGARDYDYDKNGNRVQLIADSVTTPATYDPNSNRMDTLGATDVVLDTSGNTLNNGIWSYSYTPHNQLSTATENSMLQASFTYNGLGQRVSKQSAHGRHYLYDPSGNLLVEADSEGNILLEYLYLNGQLLAVFSPDSDQDGQSNQQEAALGSLPANTDDDGDGLTNLTEWFQHSTDSVNPDSDGDGAEDGWEVSAGTSPLNAASLPAGDGDINRDGEINAGDLALLYQFVLGIRTPTESEFAHSDMHQDGQLTAQDLLKLQQLLLQAWLDGGTRLANGVVMGRPTATEFAWLDDLISPANAVPANRGKLYYVHNDPLGTPQVMTDESGAMIWKADSDPFGRATIDEDVDADGVSVQLNVRFPGQYYDQETVLHYNYFRDYDPSTGRYIQSDPIGLRGGLNTYAYVGANPLSRIDPLGLDADTLGIDINIPFVGGVEFGVVVYDGTNGGGLYGTAGLFDIGLFGTLKKPHGGFASGRLAATFGQTTGCRSNFEGIDVEANLGVGPGGVAISGAGDSKSRNEGYSFSVGPSLGYEVQLTGTGSITIGDLVRAATSLITGSNVPWRGNDGCGCSE